MEPEVRFARAPDGTNVKYAVLGAGNPLLLVPAWGLSNFVVLWERPEARPFFESLAHDRTLIIAFRRGAGMPDLRLAGTSMAEQVADLEAVISESGLERFEVFAMDDGASIAVRFAANKPSAVTRLILWAPYHRAGGSSNRKVQSALDMIRSNWALGRRVFADLNLPSGSGETRRWLGEYFRRSFSADTAVAYNTFAADADISAVLSQLSMPVLVLHRVGDRLLPFKVGEKTAALIPNARLLSLDGDAHPPFFGDQSFLGAVGRFLGFDRTLLAAPSPVRAVIFTDLVGHTEMMQRLGDAAGRAVLREHERITREVLAQHGGVEVKTMGDGFMASFGSVTKGLECAVALQRAFAERNVSESEPLSVRVGLNAGEPIEEEGDLFGSTVILAARIAAQAGGGEILASVAVRELAMGKGFLFADRGETAVRGFEDPVRLFEVRWRD